jgi:hypothetical protein
LNAGGKKSAAEVAAASKISGIGSGTIAGLIEHAPSTSLETSSSSSSSSSSSIFSPRTLSSSSSSTHRHYEALGGALLSSAQFFPSFAAGSFSHRSELALFPTQPMPKLIEVRAGKIVPSFFFEIFWQTKCFIFDSNVLKSLFAVNLDCTCFG